MIDIKRKALLHADIFTVKNVGTEEQRADLLKQVLDHKNSNEKSIGNSNPGCWRQSCAYYNMGWLTDTITNLLRSTMKYYSEIDFVFLNLSETIKKTDTEAWVNVNSKGAGNILHSHKGVSFACVYYLQSKDTGNLVFSNPANILSYDCHDLSPFVHSKIVAPDDGDLIMWPSWVPHLVEPNMSDKDRINLAFNIRLNEKEGDPVAILTQGEI